MCLLTRQWLLLLHCARMKSGLMVAWACSQACRLWGHLCVLAWTLHAHACGVYQLAFVQLFVGYGALCAVDDAALIMMMHMHVSLNVCMHVPATSPAPCLFHTQQQSASRLLSTPSSSWFCARAIYSHMHAGELKAVLDCYQHSGMTVTQHISDGVWCWLVSRTHQQAVFLPGREQQHVVCSCAG